jgi:hypothetical protein
MRESRSYGSVRGVAGDRYPYRDWLTFVLRRWLSLWRPAGMGGVPLIPARF